MQVCTTKTATATIIAIHLERVSIVKPKMRMLGVLKSREEDRGPEPRQGTVLPGRRTSAHSYPLATGTPSCICTAACRGQRITKAENYAILRHCVYDMKPFST